MALNKEYYGEHDRLDEDKYILYRSHREAEPDLLDLGDENEAVGPEDVASPIEPIPGPGTIFRPTPRGFEVVPQYPEEFEKQDPAQITLHRRIRRRITRIYPSISRISNEHPALFDEFTDHASFVDLDISEIDVPSIWSTGHGLAQFVSAFENQQPGTITEPLEPELLADLRGLINDHFAFILGFSRGRELASRAAALRDIRNSAQVQGSTNEVLQSMLHTAHLLSTRAQLLIGTLNRALSHWDSVAYLLLSGGVETSKNGLIAVGRALHPLVLTAAGVDVALTLTGNENADTLRAAAVFLRNNSEAIAAFAASDPELSLWLGWLLDRLKYPGRGNR